MVPPHHPRRLTELLGNPLRRDASDREEQGKPAASLPRHTWSPWEPSWACPREEGTSRAETLGKLVLHGQPAALRIEETGGLDGRSTSSHTTDAHYRRRNARGAARSTRARDARMM